MLHLTSKRKKTFENTRQQADWFKCFRAFPMKHDARVFEITSSAEEINFSECFSSQILLIHLMVAQKHFKPRVFEIHLVNQQVVFHWVSNAFP